jgi:hypothetical protein
MLLVPVMLSELVALSPVIICGIIVVLSLINDVVLLEVVMLPVMFVSLLAVVVFSISLDVVVSPVSKIRVAIEPLAENVSPPVALVVLVVVFVVLVALVLPVAFVLVVVFCATAGERLNAAAKSPKTSTSATAIGAFFIAENVHK